VIGAVEPRFRPGNLVLQLMLGLISASEQAERALAVARPRRRGGRAPIVAAAGGSDALIALALGLLSARGTLLSAVSPLRRPKVRPAARPRRARAPGSLLR